MSRARAIVGGLVAAALCAAAMWLWKLDPKLQAGNLNPLQTHGRIGEVVTNDVFSVRIDGYDVAASVTKKFGNVPHVADGVFMVIHFHARAEHEPYTMGHARLETTDGLSYREGGRGGIFGGAEKTYEAMLWSPGTMLFEVPKDRLAGVRLVVGQNIILNQLSAESVIDLGIDKAKAAQLAARPRASYELSD